MTKQRLQMDGIITVLNTPFTNAGTIDLPGLGKNAALAMDAGVAGFLVPALASEVGKLTEDERDSLVAEVVRRTAGRVPVIGGATAPTREARCAATRRLTALGCAGILVNIPFESEGQYADEVRAVADMGPHFLMLQDWDPSGHGLPLELISRLFREVDCFRCLKIEVVPAGVKYSAVLEATGGALHVSGGWAVTQMIEALDRGVHAIMPTGMHSVYTRIFALHRAGSRKEARELFHRLLPVLAFSNQHLDISIHFFKRLLHRQGVCATPMVRPPILPFDAAHERVADELIKHALALMAECDAAEEARGRVN